MKLNRISLILQTGCFLVAPFVGLSSCNDENIPSYSDYTISGKDVSLTVPLTLPSMDIRTRADIDNLKEVESLWVATFNATTKEKTGSIELTANLPTNDQEIPHEITLASKTGPSFIVAVANLDNMGVKKTDPTLSRETLRTLLEKVNTWQDFLDIAVVTPSDQDLMYAPKTPLPMVGAYTNIPVKDPHDPSRPLDKWGEENFLPYTIPYNSSGDFTLADGAIHLRRIVSQVKFNLNPGSGIILIPHSYQIVNVPIYSWLYERDNDAKAGLVANFGDSCTEENRKDYYSTPEAFISNNFRPLQGGGYTFDFWQAENKHTGNESCEVYNDRERIYKTPDNPDEKAYTSPEFQNTARFTSLVSGNDWTPNNMATYVLISCTVRHNGDINVDDNGKITENGSGKDVSRVGDAIYMIHLGYVGSEAKDFNCYRNTVYTYNVTINGVNDIRVEAYTPESPTPGVEGIVDDSETANMMLDCHYNAFNIQLSDSDLSPWDPDNETGFRFVITTYDNLSPTGAQKRFTEENFRNIDFDNCSFDAIRKYVDWVELRPTSAQGSLAEYQPRKGTNSDGKTFNLIDASKGITNDQKSTSGWYTVFVREYTYDPGENEQDNEIRFVDGLPFWKSYAFAQPRRFYIRVTKSVSQDGQSVYTRSKYSGTQQSMKTYYDSDVITESTEDGKQQGSAVGVENTNESFGLNLRRSFTVSDDGVNGRLNCWNFTGYTYNNGWRESGTRLWSYFINNNPQMVPTPGSPTNIATIPLPQIYQYRPNALEQNDYSPYTGNTRTYYIEAISACMNRNRDNNGNGVIDASEMRWYVPTMGKYLRILIGQNALTPNELVNYDAMPNRPSNISDGNANWGEYLFFGSDGRILWAMEGYSTSEYALHVNSGRVPPWQVRCIRNLGTDLTTVREHDQTIPAYTFEPNTAGNPRDGGKVYPTYYQDPQLRLNAYTRNGTETNQMPVHTIAESPNTLYRGGFEISNPSGNGSGNIRGVKYDGRMTASSWNDLIGYINTNPYGNRNPCTQKGDNWRIPNVREIAIMKNLGVLDVTSNPENNNRYTYNIPFLSCSMGIFDGNGTKQLTVDGFTSGVTHNFMCSLYRKHNSTQNYRVDFFITQAWFGGAYQQGGANNASGYYVRCVRDIQD